MTEKTIIHCSAHDLSPLKDKSVHTIITSPPYLNMRNYSGEQEITWPAVTYIPMTGAQPIYIESSSCALGAEPYPEDYVGHMLLCMREFWRVLRDDGTLWMVIGDGYNTQDGAFNGKYIYKEKDNPPLKPKDLIGAPWRIALAAQADGWYLRSDIIWSKTNYAPEHTLDRPTKSHEYIFLFSKQQKYYCDMFAIREITSAPDNAFHNSISPKVKLMRGSEAVNGEKYQNGLARYPIESGSHNKPTVWRVAPEPSKNKHTAAFPEKLIEPCILAGTSEFGCCDNCGAPYERIVERTDTRHWTIRVNDGTLSNKVTKGWKRTCGCISGVMPCTVLDPFVGSGTVLRVAERLGRNSIGADISSIYLEKLNGE